MLFQVYGDNAIYQWIGWILVFCCLIGANELARRTKTGGVIAFLVIPAVLTVYFITIYTAAAMGADWALNLSLIHIFPERGGPPGRRRGHGLGSRSQVRRCTGVPLAS